jgi:3-oxoacyl-[acyl-carrier protein] reductase
VTVALVTGGAGGIGTAINERLAAAGYTVLAGDLTADAAEDDSIHAARVDVTDARSVEDFVAAGAELGPIGAVVNCAGVVRFTPVTGFDDADASALWEINVAGSARVCRAAASDIVDGGAIVNIGSLTGSFGRLEGASLYGATKAGVEAYTRYLACELAPRRIRVNAIGPGSVLTEMLQVMMRDEEARRRILARTPLGRCGEPEEVARIALFLASDDASYVTGQTIYADGGRMALNYTVPVRG